MRFKQRNEEAYRGLVVHLIKLAHDEGTLTKEDLGRLQDLGLIEDDDVYHLAWWIEKLAG